MDYTTGATNYVNLRYIYITEIQLFYSLCILVYTYLFHIDTFDCTCKEKKREKP